jgi:hypothetical protein
MTKSTEEPIALNAEHYKDGVISVEGWEKLVEDIQSKELESKNPEEVVNYIINSARDTVEGLGIKGDDDEQRKKNYESIENLVKFFNERENANLRWGFARGFQALLLLAGMVGPAGSQVLNLQAAEYIDDPVKGGFTLLQAAVPGFLGVAGGNDFFHPLMLAGVGGTLGGLACTLAAFWLGRCLDGCDQKAQHEFERKLEVLDNKNELIEKLLNGPSSKMKAEYLDTSPGYFPSSDDGVSKRETAGAKAGPSDIEAAVSTPKP